MHLQWASLIELPECMDLKDILYTSHLGALSLSLERYRTYYSFLAIVSAFVKHSRGMLFLSVSPLLATRTELANAQSVLDVPNLAVLVQYNCWTRPVLNQVRFASALLMGEHG